MFMMAVLPAFNASSINLLRAEMSVVPGVSRDKILPKVREVAKIIYIIYTDNVFNHSPVAYIRDAFI